MSSIPSGEHTSRPWRIHELTPDFRLEDVWALPTPGGADDFALLVQTMRDLDLANGTPRIVRVLFAIRWKLGELFGWDRAAEGFDSRVETLRDRLPADLWTTSLGEEPTDSPFRALYLTDDEYAAEIANRTMHGVMHLSWVPDGDGGHRGQMAVLVRPNGVLGRAYMAAIKPFRHLLVYPALMRHIEHAWASRRQLVTRR
jgi:hypothetical protein